MSKKNRKSKWFRVAVEGATTDGREIQRNWIEEMAEQYDTNTYGARINCEHFKSMWPGGEFGAYGDVLGLKAEEVEIDGKTKLALFAQIEPTESLIQLNKDRQKIYTSIEVHPEFADTGKAYLVGLAITDSPACLGVEALSFSSQSGMLANRKSFEGTLFTAAEPTEIELTEENNSAFADIKEKISALFARTSDAAEKGNANADALASFSEITEQMLELATAQQTKQEELSEQVEQANEQVAALSTELEALKEAFAQSETAPHRPPVTGGEGQQLAQY